MIAFKTIRSICALGGVVGLSIFISEFQEGYASPPLSIGENRPGPVKQFTPRNAPQPRNRIDNYGTPIRHSVSSIQNANGSMTYTVSGIDPEGTMYSRNMRVLKNGDGSYLIDGSGLNLKNRSEAASYIVTPTYDPVTDKTTYKIVDQSGQRMEVQVNGDGMEISNPNMEQIFFAINGFTPGS